MKTRNLLAVAGLCVLALLGCSRQPEKPIELALKLAKTKVEAGEYLWYLVEIKNVGRKPVTINDDFWFRQEALYYEDYVRVEIIGPDGEKVSMLNRPFGYHGESKLWTSDCGGGRSCDPRVRYSHVLKGGETMTATPSIVAPIRPQRTDIMDDPGDIRGIPYEPEGWSKEQIEALKKRWKETVEKRYLLGDLGPPRGSTAPAVSRPRGYRVLDVYGGFDDPGPYRMRVLYGIFGGIVHPVKGGFDLSEPRIDLEELEKRFKWISSDYPTLSKIDYAIQRLFKGRYFLAREHLRESGWPEETRVRIYESNWVTFEVEPRPFPDHLYRSPPGETAKERALREELKRTMRERIIWSDDSPEVRQAKLKRNWEAKEKLRQKYKHIEGMIPVSADARQKTGEAKKR